MEISQDSSPYDLLTKERMVRRFAAWLDRALDDEPLPPGLTPELLAALSAEDDPDGQNEQDEPAPEAIQAAIESRLGEAGDCDLYALWSAMTTLSQEVRLEGRAFKQLNETLTASARETEVVAARSASASQPRRQEVDLLLELRDRIERGGNSARQAAVELNPSRLPWLARRLGVGTGYARHAQEVVGALADGYSLILASVDEALVAWGVNRIVCDSQPFDPHRMNVVDIEQTRAVPEGTVVEVYRNGYEWNGELHRPAQVKVARDAPANR